MNPATRTTQTTFRSATRDDCYAIAQLMRIASDGVSDYVWSTLTDEHPGLTPIEIGARRYANPDSLFSYKNCVLAEQAGEIIGMLLTFPFEEAEATGLDHTVSQEIPPALTPDVLEASEPDVLAPYSLETPGTWYICALALFPAFRGQGIGTQLLSIAHQQAAKQGFSELSLLCFEQNVEALKLYQRHGFKVIDRNRVVPHPLIHHTGDVLLMTAPVQV
ncbi:MAG: GNAT family N-acetyltransferase [Leptolyngbyaceae cyanobacterium bins.349]|nr:GNAT family N-acetyltransferase [Leptolyngbyaceae cyanobacterium bins.349]